MAAAKGTMAAMRQLLTYQIFTTRRLKLSKANILAELLILVWLLIPEELDNIVVVLPSEGNTK